MRLLQGIVAVVLTAATMGYTAGQAFAQNFPTRPITIVVPFPPGGALDWVSRSLAQSMSAAYGKPAVVENRPGAGGNIGTEHVARAAPDGHTLLMTASQHSIQPTLQKLSWESLKDFEPVALVISYPAILSVHPSVPANSLAEFIALAKAQPGKLSYGSSGTGGILFFAMELFKNMAGVDIVHVPYKGIGPMSAALLSGEVQVTMDSNSVLPHVRSGKVRALAMSGTKRLSAAPNLPTMAEAGLPGFEMKFWGGILAPAKTPKEVVARLNTEIVKALNAPDALRDRLVNLGFEAEGGTPEQFAQLIAVDVVRYAKIIKDANIKLD